MTIKCFDKLPDEAVKIRTLVFVEEQGFKDEFDSIDEIATHIVMFDGDNPVAVGRFFPSENEGEYIVGRVAVKKEYRGKNLGAEILKVCEVEIKKIGGTGGLVSAQVQAENFYKKQGYVSVGETYFDEHCPHIKMIKNL